MKSSRTRMFLLPEKEAERLERERWRSLSPRECILEIQELSKRAYAIREGLRERSSHE